MHTMPTMKLTLCVVGILLPFGVSANFFRDYSGCLNCCSKDDQPQNVPPKVFSWRSDGIVNSSAVLGFHKEIQQFYEHMQLTPTERAVRENVVSRIKSIVQQLWPNARLKNYGSFSYGLTLPTGDIDIMILENGNKSLIRSLAAQIRSSNIAQANSIQVKDDLRIPIIEFIERESKINIDMPFLNEPTLKVAALLNGYKDEYPVFVKLVIVLKQFLGQRGLNDVFIGGISSYALCLMCINFLEMHPKTKANDDVNLGALLLDFLELYGENFDYENTGTRIGNGGKCFPRNELPCGLVDGQFRLFCVVDEVNPWLNACSVSYRAPDIRKAFSEAYHTLLEALQNVTNEPNTNILNRIVSIGDDVLEYRRWIQNNFHENGTRLSTN